RHQHGAFDRRQRGEAVACRASLTVVRENRVLDGARPPVVEEGGDDAQTPERGGAHLGAGRLALGDAAAELAHVGEQEGGVRGEAREWKGRDGARAGPERRHVAARAAGLREETSPPMLASGPRTGQRTVRKSRGVAEVETRRRGEEGHEVPEGLDVVEV